MINNYKKGDIVWQRSNEKDGDYAFKKVRIIKFIKENDRYDKYEVEDVEKELVEPYSLNTEDEMRELLHNEFKSKLKRLEKLKHRKFLGII